MIKQREQWGSKLGFILAAAGSAVGLGNIWKFPYLVGENGGAAFILLYLIGVLIIGVPAVIAEILIGRTAGKNPVGSFRDLSKGNPFWIGVGFLGVLTGFIILSYYNVIAGWSLGYIVESVKNSFATIDNPANAGELFGCLSASPRWSLWFHGGFMVFSVLIIMSGVQKGIEKASKLLMPLLLGFIIILVIRGITLPGAAKGIRYLSKVDFSAVTAQTVLLALGQAFFSLSLGMGALLTYGSYMSKNDDIVNCSLNIVTLDTLIAVLSGFMIFPALFAMNMTPDQGPALIFNILPVLFNAIPGGYFFRIIFFILLSVAALTSTISLLEVITSYTVDEFNISRKKATILLASIVFLLGIPCALSFGIMETFTVFEKTFFGMMDFLASNIFLPVGGMLISIFAGWFWKKDEVMSALKEGTKIPDKLLNLWYFLIRYIVPVIILFVFLSSIGLF
jgi:NSS family neurotransmitter:Na+ symporter